MNRREIDNICRELGINKNYTINPDGSVDVDGSVNISGRKLDKIPIKFRRVSDNFYCYNNKLTNLEGAPKYVGHRFNCDYNKITSLEGGPTVGGDFYCRFNKLTSLKGGPTTVGNDFSCSDNKLTSLEGAPITISGEFYCSSNKLTNLKGAPINVGDFYCDCNKLTSLEGIPSIRRVFSCSYNPIYSIVKHFIDRNDKNQIIELFNYADVIQGGKVLLVRLKYIFDEFDIPLTDKRLDEIGKRMNLYKFKNFTENQDIIKEGIHTEHILDISREYIKHFNGFINSPQLSMEFIKESHDVMLNITTTKNWTTNYPFDIWAHHDWDDEISMSIIIVSIEVNPEYFPKSYNSFIAELKETLTHEFIHSTQLTTDTKPVSGFFDEVMLKHEIPAYVRGLYKRAKVEKKSLSRVIDEWLESRKSLFKTGEIDIVRKVFREYAEKHLPSSIFD